jgi:hypothetical protein
MTKVTEEVSENIIVFTHAPYYICKSEPMNGPPPSAPWGMDDGIEFLPWWVA